MSSGNHERELLDRATAALERIDAAMVRQAESFDRQAESFDRQAASHDQLMRRMDRRDTILVQAIGDIDLSLQRNTDRLQDMTAAIRDIRDDLRAHTKAVFSMLDRLGPAGG